MTDEPVVTLSLENLVPFYIIEDRLKDNFNKIEKALKRQMETNQNMHSKTDKINEYNARYKE